MSLEKSTDFAEVVANRPKVDNGWLNESPKRKAPKQKLPVKIPKGHPPLKEMYPT